LHRHDRSRFRRDRRFNRRWVDQEVLSDIDKNRNGAHSRYRIGGSDERQSRHNDLVAGADVQAFQGQEERRSARPNAYGKRNVTVLGSPALEVLDLGSIQDYSRLKNGINGTKIFAAFIFLNAQIEKTYQPCHAACGNWSDV
jgi:hypothetical protein